jgi:hypothetical protein
LRITAKSKTLVVAASAPRGKDLLLVELRPYQTHDPKSNLPSVWRGKLSGNPIEILRFDGARDRLYAKFQLVDAKTRTALGNAHYVDDLSALGARDFDFPNPKSIKGLQVQDVDDAIALGVKYGAVNVLIPQIIHWSDAAPQETWEVDGEKIPMNVAYVRQLDAQFKKLTDTGINVTAILLNGVPKQPDPKNPLIHPNTDLAHAPFHLGAFNVTDERGLRYYRAAVEYLANRYSQPDAPHGWVSGYIIGNEVQAHWEWYNIGRMPLDEFVQHYGIALRVADLAARRFHAKIRTYVSMDHHWNSAHRADPLRAFRGNDFLTALNQWAKAEGDFPWHVAFHPYPENLFEPRFWNDKQAPLSFDAPKVTFKNIEVLTAFLEQKQFLYDGKPRRIILSEQGFHTPNGEDGEKIQAAAYAYAYYKLSHTPGIDAFILHRHVDHKQEGGLKLGLWTWKDDDPAPSAPGKKKFIYEVFRLADTDQWKEAFEFAKPLIGIKNWSDALPAKKVEKDAWFGPIPPNLVYDVYQNINQAKRENCLDWRTDSIQKDGRALLTIFHHPPEKGVGDATFEIPLPVLKENDRLTLRFGTAFTGPTANGVRFSVLVNGKEAWTTTQKELPPVEREVDLSAWAGKTIQLTLRVDGLGNIQHDWANWVRPQVLVEKKDGDR